jgi:hypothetical protein
MLYRQFGMICKWFSELPFTPSTLLRKHRQEIRNADKELHHLVLEKRDRDQKGKPATFDYCDEPKDEGWSRVGPLVRKSKEGSDDGNSTGHCDIMSAFYESVVNEERKFLPEGAKRVSGMYNSYVDGLVRKVKDFVNST